MHLNISKTFLMEMEKELPAIMDETITIRRYLHMHPEIGFDTKGTENLVIEKLREIGIEILSSKIGVLGLIYGQDRNRTIALRADMDALCIQEENDVSYCSIYPGKMHACGHDGHTAMLLGTAKILNAHRNSLPTNVLLIFQPAEEGPGLCGANPMLANMKEMGISQYIEMIFGIHLFNDYPVGTVCFRYGPMFASCDEFDINITGHGGHAGQPHNCIDALSIGAKIVTSMECFMSRCINPLDSAVLSFGSFHAGSARNIIADKAVLSGTIRCQKEETRLVIGDNLTRIVKNICNGFRAECNIEILRGLPVLKNDNKVVDYAMAVAEEYVAKDKIILLSSPSMSSEDFAFFSEAIPSAFLWIGSGNKEKGFIHLGHHRRFDFDEVAMETGIKILCGLAMSLRKRND